MRRAIAVVAAAVVAVPVALCVAALVDEDRERARWARDRARIADRPTTPA